MFVLGVLNTTGDLDLFSVYSVLVMLVEVTFFPKFFPCALSIFSNDLCLFQFASHAFDLSLHPNVFALDISNETNTQILEGSLLLQFVPLLLENVHRFCHFNLGQEVADKVINHYIALKGAR